MTTSAHVDLLGHIGSAGTLKALGTTHRLGFTLATSERRQVASGEWEDLPPTWWHVRVWGERGKRLAERIAKGDLVRVRGSTRLETWTGRDGKPHHDLLVTADLVQVLVRAADRSPRPTAPEAAPAPSPTTPPPSATAAANGDDEPPF